MAATDFPLLGGDALAALVRDPAARLAYAPPDGAACLVIDSDAAAGAASPAALADWLAALPCPSVAVGSAQTPLARCCDAQVAHLDEARALVAGIRRAPVAAAICAQLLRATEHLALEPALQMESLAYATLQAGPEFRRWLAQARPAVPPREAGPAVLLARDDGGLRLTLNRPAGHNAMSVEMRDALCEALQLALLDASIGRVRIDALGACFSTGGELAEFGSTPDPAQAHLIRALSLPGRLLAACAARAEVRVHGACIGSGIEFPAFAARVIAAPDAWFQLPELRYGLLPGAGGCVSIARRIGRQRTAALVFGGRRIDARTALAWGLVDAIAAAPGP